MVIDWNNPCEDIDRNKKIIKTLSKKEMNQINEHFKKQSEKQSERRLESCILMDSSIYYK